jgi:hypothetical protein
MHLQRVTEHDEDNNGGAADGGSEIGWVHGDDVTRDVGAVGEVARDGDEDVDAASSADGGDYDGSSAEGGGEGYFVKNGEHLCSLALFLTIKKPQIEGEENTYILVTSIRKYNDRKTSQCLHRALPFPYVNFTSIDECVAFDEMREDEDDQVANCDEGYNGGVLERIEAAQEGEGDDYQPIQSS